MSHTSKYSGHDQMTRQCNLCVGCRMKDERLQKAVAIWPLCIINYPQEGVNDALWVCPISVWICHILKFSDPSMFVILQSHDQCRPVAPSLDLNNICIGVEFRHLTRQTFTRPILVPYLAVTSPSLSFGCLLSIIQFCSQLWKLLPQELMNFRIATWKSIPIRQPNHFQAF